MGLEQVIATYPPTEGSKTNLVMTKYTSFNEINQKDMDFLINSSFNKTNKPEEFGKVIDPLYFKETKPAAIYLLHTEAGEYAGIIITTTIPPKNSTDSITYIDKLAVSPDHQKNGHFWKLMTAVEEDLTHIHGSAKMALRCNPANECAVPKYDKWSDHKDIMGDNVPQWLVYSKGLTLEEQKGAFDYAKDQKVYWQYKKE